MEVGHIGLTDLIAGSKNCGQFACGFFPLNILKRLAPASRLYREMIMITTQVDLHQFPRGGRPYYLGTSWNEMPVLATKIVDP